MVAVERANKYANESQDQMKAFKSKLLMSDVLQEREVQLALKKRKQDHEKRVEKAWEELEAKIVRWNILDTGRRIDGRDVKTVRDIVEELYQKHVRTVEQVGGINADEFVTLNKSLHRLERFWTDQILYRL